MGKRTETIIDDTGADPGAAEQPKKRRSKADEVSFEDTQTNLTRIFNAISSFMKSDKTYKESDFTEEARDLSRMAKKYEMVNYIMTMLAPIFLLLGFVSKFNEIRKAAPKKEKVKPDEDVTHTDNSGAVGNVGGSIAQFTPYGSN